MIMVQNQTKSSKSKLQILKQGIRYTIVDTCIMIIIQVENMEILDLIVMNRGMK